jgi:hypothetical protein
MLDAQSSEPDQYAVRLVAPGRKHIARHYPVADGHKVFLEIAKLFRDHQEAEAVEVYSGTRRILRMERFGRIDG